MAGCAVRVVSHYEMEAANPGGPPEAFTFPTPDTIDVMQTDIEAAKRNADIVIASFHKGLVHQPAKVAMYERPVTKAAVEAGADIGLGHHAHILKGVEVYRGRPVFHGLGNFVTVTKALNVEGSLAGRKAWAIKRKEMFGFEPDPAYPLYPFHPGQNAMIACCDVAADSSMSAGLSRAGSSLGRAAAAWKSEGERSKHMSKRSPRGWLKASFAWDGERVVFNDAAA